MPSFWSLKSTIISPGSCSRPNITSPLRIATLSISFFILSTLNIKLIGLPSLRYAQNKNLVDLYGDRNDCVALGIKLGHYILVGTK